MKLKKTWVLTIKLCIKRVIDVMVSIFLLITLSPLFIYLYYKISRDGGSAIFGHERIGKNGKKFQCYKFRSMIVNSQEVLEQLLANNPKAKAEWDKDFKLKNDPRVTKIGQFLRRTSIDELPQLWNVLKGDMSLVGPRPIIESELERYHQFSQYYISVKPGMTGLWQISGRNDTTYDERVQLDIQYIINWSLWRDFIILVQTLFVVFARKGAY
ncbi:sugar transferase [Orbaceae bacterium ESL0721]|nr:sugar transferase [Orbaceae bacterium ESL0721]